jgi:hypothetical protein
MYPGEHFNVTGSYSGPHWTIMFDLLNLDLAFEVLIWRSTFWFRLANYVFALQIMFSSCKLCFRLSKLHLPWLHADG